MTKEKMAELFEKHEDDYGFEKVNPKRANRADLHAFQLLDELVPVPADEKYPSDIIGAAEHDEFWVHIDLDKLAKVITEPQIIELIRCGARLDEDRDGLSFFC